jgi:hypothetical protein
MTKAVGRKERGRPLASSEVGELITIDPMDDTVPDRDCYVFILCGGQLASEVLV